MSTSPVADDDKVYFLSSTSPEFLNEQERGHKTEQLKDVILNKQLQMAVVPPRKHLRPSHTSRQLPPLTSPSSRPTSLLHTAPPPRRFLQNT